MWGFLDLSRLARRLFKFYGNAIVPCVVSQTHLKYFKWPGSATIVSHILQFIAVLHSLCMKEGKREKEGGMQQWQSHDLSHSSGGLCRGLLVPVWEIRQRHGEAGRGESWSRPQIAPLRATAAVSLLTMVVCWEASGGVFCPWKSQVQCFIKAALTNIFISTTDQTRVIWKVSLTETNPQRIITWFCSSPHYRL